MKTISQVEDRLGSKKEPFDIFLIGLGIQNVNHITREAEEALSSTNHVFYVDSGFGIEDFLQSLSPKVTSLLSCYKNGENRREAYIQMATYVVSAAFVESPVCFATYGHPTIYVHPASLIQEAANLLDLKVKVIAGVSAFDTIIIDLGIDPGPEGIQMYEASDLLLKERPLQNDVPCLLWQVDALETGLFTHRRSVAERFERFKAHLIKFYPKDHQVTLVLSSTHRLLDPIKITFTLDEMPQRLSEGIQSGTLYIPPVRSREIKNTPLLKQAYDVSHLKKITRF